MTSLHFCSLDPFCPTARGPGPSLRPQLPSRDTAGPPRRTPGSTTARSPSGTFPLLAVSGRPWLPATTTLHPKPGSAGTRRCPLSPAPALRRWPEKTPDTRGAGRTAAPLPHASVQTQGRVVLSAPVTQIARGGHSRMSLAVPRKRLQKDTLTCHLLSLDLEQDRKPLALT